MSEPSFELCDHINPLMIWYSSFSSNLWAMQQWMLNNGGRNESVGLGHFGFVPDEQTKLLFILRWS